MVWQRTRLGDLVETQKGYAFKSFWYSETGTPIVKVSNFTGDSVDSSALVCIPKGIAADYLNYELKTGDVVVQTVGSWPANPASVVGKCIRVPKGAAGALLNQNAVKLSPFKCLARSFLYYLLRSDDFKTYIIGTAQGAASQAAITLEAIRAYQFNLPSLAAQRNIAGILSAYDELMEICQRRICILEEMARALYHEWFVHFRFPGHEKVPRVDSSLGPIPQGWECAPLSGIINVTHGYAFQGSHFSEEPTSRVLATPGNFRAGGGIKYDKPKFYREEGPLDSAYIFEPMDLMVSMTDLSKAGDTLGFPAFVPKLNGLSFLHNQRIGKVVPVGEFFPKHFLHCLFCHERYRHHVVGGATGMAVKHTSPTRILNYTSAIPKDGKLIHAFENFARPVFQQINCLIEALQNLRRTRDLLLPRLLSGQVSLDVSAVEDVALGTSS